METRNSRIPAVLSRHREADGQGTGCLTDQASAIFPDGPRGLLRALNSPLRDAMTIADDYRKITAMAGG